MKKCLAKHSTTTKRSYISTCRYPSPASRARLRLQEFASDFKSLPPTSRAHLRLQELASDFNILPPTSRACLRLQRLTSNFKITNKLQVQVQVAGSVAVPVHHLHSQRFVAIQIQHQASYLTLRKSFLQILENHSVLFESSHCTRQALLLSRRQFLHALSSHTIAHYFSSLLLSPLLSYSTISCYVLFYPILLCSALH